jgi:hypothetical protein
MELTIRGYHPGFGTKFGWLLRSKVMGTSDHFRYSGGSERDRHDLSGYEFMFPP